MSVKEFFSSKVTKTVSWVALGVSVAVLAIGGVSGGDMSKFVETTLAGLAGLGAIVAFVSERVKDKKDDE